MKILIILLFPLSMFAQSQAPDYLFKAVNDSTFAWTAIKTINGLSIFGSGNIAATTDTTSLSNRINERGYTLNVQALTSSPTDAQTIYFGQLPKAPVTAAANRAAFYISYNKIFTK